MVKKYKGFALIVLLPGILLAGCAALEESPEEAITSEVTTQQPIRLNINQKYVKYRKVNRRIIHRTQRLHKS